MKKKTKGVVLPKKGQTVALPSNSFPVPSRKEMVEQFIALLVNGLGTSEHDWSSYKWTDDLLVITHKSGARLNCQIAKGREGVNRIGQMETLRRARNGDKPTNSTHSEPLLGERFGS